VYYELEVGLIVIRAWKFSLWFSVKYWGHRGPGAAVGVEQLITVVTSQHPVV
jgi:hypothetical protein